MRQLKLLISGLEEGCVSPQLESCLDIPTRPDLLAAVPGGLCCTAPGRSGDVLDIAPCHLSIDLGVEAGARQCDSRAGPAAVKLSCLATDLR